MVYRVDYSGNIYDEMLGDLIKEYEHAVLLEIPFKFDKYRVMFYKYQVKQESK